MKKGRMWNINCLQNTPLVNGTILPLLFLHYLPNETRSVTYILAFLRGPKCPIVWFLNEFMLGVTLNVESYKRCYFVTPPKTLNLNNILN